MNIHDINVENQGLDRKRLEARLRSLSTNVMREAKVAHGRADEPFTDDDAQRMQMVFELLHLAETELVKEYEHYPLVSTKQTEPNPILDKISDLLTTELDEEIRELTVTAQPVKKAVKA